MCIIFLLHHDSSVIYLLLSSKSKTTESSFCETCFLICRFVHYNHSFHNFIVLTFEILFHINALFKLYV